MNDKTLTVYFERPLGEHIDRYVDVEILLPWLNRPGGMMIPVCPSTAQPSIVTSMQITTQVH